MSGGLKLCEWTLYDGSRCTKNCKGDTKGVKFCTRHHQILSFYKLATNQASDDEQACVTSKTIKIVPRSKDHIKNMMSSLKYEDSDTVDIMFTGGSIESGDISDDEYIELNDGTKYYYNSTVRGSYKAKDIKILMYDHCPNDPAVIVNGIVYCKKCYINKEIGPTINTIKEYLNISKVVKKEPIAKDSESEDESD